MLLPSCSSGSVGRGGLEYDLANLLQEPGKLESEYQSRLATSEQDGSEQERKRLESELRRLDKAANRFLDLYGDEQFDREQLDNKLYENSGQKKSDQ